MLCIWSLRFQKDSNIVYSITRSTQRAQNSTAPNLRSVKGSHQAGNSLANCSLCPYPENSMNIHPSLIPFVWRKHENMSPCIGSRVNPDPENRKMDPVFQGLNASSPKCSRLFQRVKGNGWSDGTKPLPEPVSTYNQWSSLAFTWDQFRRKCSRYRFVKWISKIHLWNCFDISQGPMR